MFGFLKKNQEMTEAEIHEYGIDIVARHMRENGFKIEKILKNIQVVPQIIARNDQQLIFVAVRTACYPETGILGSYAVCRMLDLAEKSSAVPYLASVGLSNAAGRTDKEKGQLSHGVRIYTFFEGLVEIRKPPGRRGTSNISGGCDTGGYLAQANIGNSGNVLLQRQAFPSL